MNVLEGRLEGGGFALGDLLLPVGSAPAASAGRGAYYGIRPEHFQLRQDGIPAEVVVVEPTGSETQVVAKAGGREITCVFRERVNARPGEVIHIAPNPALVHLFDKDTGQRIN
jgi:multiple sugar transport system ATP-binding protein